MYVDMCVCACEHIVYMCVFYKVDVGLHQVDENLCIKLMDYK